MKKNEQKVTLSFSTSDFYNKLEEQNFIETLACVKDPEAFIKQAAIHRSMVENQGSKNQYEILMGYIQSKGIDYIIERIEGKKEGLDEQRVRALIREELSSMNLSQNVSPLPSAIEGTEYEKVVSQEKRKASSKLLKL